MTPSGKTAAPGESGEMGECNVQDVAAAMVGLLGGVVSDVVGASAFLGGSWKFLEVSVCLRPCSQRVLTHPPYGAYPEAMRQTLANRCPPVPWGTGAIRTEKVLQQRLRVRASRHWGELRGD